MLIRTTMLLLIGAGIGCVLGCGRPQPNQSDPALGRETLRNALEAWKKGNAIETYKQAVPSVTIVDQDWNKGIKLLDFEILDEGEPDGFDIQFKARLEVKDASGKRSKQKAVYNVSTTPALVIVRMEPPGGG